MFELAGIPSDKKIIQNKIFSSGHFFDFRIIRLSWRRLYVVRHFDELSVIPQNIHALTGKFFLV